MKKLLVAVAALALLQGCTGEGSGHAEKAEGGGCPMGFDGGHTTDQISTVKKNGDWWPNQLNLEVLKQNSELVNPLGDEFNYEEAFAALDYDALKADIEADLTD